jgi:ZIP family zinc transporter
MLVFAVALHNLPEGMAVGAAYSAIVSGDENVSLSAAFTLSLGIAIQNFPEGAIISMPLNANGLNKNKSFAFGVLSGVIEPLGACLTILVSVLVTGISCVLPVRSATDVDPALVLKGE